MSIEKQSGNPTQIPEKNLQNKKERELSAEEKRQAVLVWKEMVLGVETMPENMEQLNDLEIKKWLSASLNLEIDNLSKDWDLNPNSDLIKKVSEAENAEEKSKAQVEYIQACYSQIENLVLKFKESPIKSTRWNSWPKTMRQYKSFNCVGASLLGQCLLEKAGIKNYLGNPAGHVVDIAHLENGDWWYIDFLNGKLDVRKIEPRETEICGNPVLELDNSPVSYKLIPLYNVSEAPGSVLRNLDCLVNEAGSESISDENPDKIAAKKIFYEHGEIAKNTNFNTLLIKLYPDRFKFADSPEMKNERKRIDYLFEIYDDIFGSVRKKYSKEQREAAINDLKRNIGIVKDLLMTENEFETTLLGEDAKNILKIYKEKLREVKKNNFEMYSEMLEHIIEAISI